MMPCPTLFEYVDYTINDCTVVNYHTSIFINQRLISTRMTSSLCPEPVKPSNKAKRGSKQAASHVRVIVCCFYLFNAYTKLNNYLRTFLPPLNMNRVLTVKSCFKIEIIKNEKSGLVIHFKVKFLMLLSSYIFNITPNVCFTQSR